MSEKVGKKIFVLSGHIKDKSDIASIEFWGHDAGEFVEEESKNAKDLLDIQRAEWEGMTTEEQEQYEKELVEALEQDLLEGSTPG